MTRRLAWGNDALTVEFEWSADSAPRIAAIGAAGVRLTMPPGLPLADVLTASEGHVLANDRLVHTVIGHESRYLRHEDGVADGIRTLELSVGHQGTGLDIAAHFTVFDGLAVLKSEVTVTNGGSRPVVLRSVPSVATYLGGDGESTVRDWNVHHALSDWLGEGRWIREPLDGIRFPRLGEHLTAHNPRGEFRVISTGTWSTGKHLPVAGVSSARLGASWAWQLDHNGAWRWEIGEDTASGYVALSGPTDTDHQWVKVLDPGESFATVPAVLALSADFTAALQELTKYRRKTRREHIDNHSMGVVFNDYMNTLNGDPTTDKLLPLIDAAAQAGAEIFCIDAGWYDDSGSWWDSVGEWRPSTTRFPGGISRVIDRIRAAGMVPGLWLEPEVVGVRSPVATRLPAGAFFQRLGQRIVEHERYHLDLRHPAAREYLDQVIDRLVSEFGIGYFKLDYNINPGAGTDANSDSVGAGLLDHNRAHLAWLDGILDRHPDLILENCASGGMRTDFAMLSRMQLQSTSDQQDYLRYAPIAASAPAMMLPEQAANWAYPQPGMTSEEIAFCLATGLLGRFYLSGYLSRMNADERDLVGEAVAVAKELRPQIAKSIPCWPLGLPNWDHEWIALGLASGAMDSRDSRREPPDTGDNVLVTVWNRGAESPAELRFPALTGRQIRVDTIFPRALPSWETHWDPASATLQINSRPGQVGARVFHLSGVDS